MNISREQAMANPTLRAALLKEEARTRGDGRPGAPSPEAVKGTTSPSDIPLSGASHPRLSFCVHGNPLSLNHAYPTGPGGRRYHSKEGKAWAKAVAFAAAAAKGSRPPFEGPVGVSLVLHFSSRRPDLDNAIKPVLDGLKGAIWGDDRQVEELVAHKRLDRENPRAEVIVWAVEEGR